jgi:structural maintenance of chromosome 2
MYTSVCKCVSALVLLLQDTGTAKKLAFAREVNTRCITLEGDDFNPSGLLTGAAHSTQRKHSDA